VRTTRGRSRSAAARTSSSVNKEEVSEEVTSVYCRDLSSTARSVERSRRGGPDPK
jgi:hypothetical protein